jgi:hypothetical protein
MASAEGQQIDTLPVQMYGWNGVRPVKILGSGLKSPTAKIVDDVSTANVTYIGVAPVGSLVSDALWSIKKIDESGSPNTVVITWAGGGEFDQVWNNRLSLTYA